MKKAIQFGCPRSGTDSDIATGRLIHPWNVQRDLDRNPRLNRRNPGSSTRETRELGARFRLAKTSANWLASIFAASGIEEWIKLLAMIIGQPTSHYQRHGDGLAFRRTGSPAKACDYKRYWLGDRIRGQLSNQDCSPRPFFILPKMNYTTVGEIDQRSAMSAITALWVITTGASPTQVYSLDRFKHDNACTHVQRAGRFVTQEHLRPLGNGARDRHPLLFPARQLGWEMVQAPTQVHHFQCLLKVPSDDPLSPL
jgi:hypothetical protein